MKWYASAKLVVSVFVAGSILLSLDGCADTARTVDLNPPRPSNAVALGEAKTTSHQPTVNGTPAAQRADDAQAMVPVPKIMTPIDSAAEDPALRTEKVEVKRRTFARYINHVIAGRGPANSPGDTLWLKADTNAHPTTKVLWAYPGWANAEVLQIDGQDVAQIGVRKAFRIISTAPEPMHFLVRSRGGAVATIEVFTTYREPVADIPKPSDGKGPLGR